MLRAVTPAPRLAPETGGRFLRRFSAAPLLRRRRLPISMLAAFAAAAVAASSSAVAAAARASALASARLVPEEQARARHVATKAPAHSAHSGAPSAPAAAAPAAILGESPAAKLVSAVARVVAKQVKVLSHKQNALRSQLQDPELAEEWRRRGDALLVLPARNWRRGLSQVEVPDYTKLDSAGRPSTLVVELNPDLDFRENAQAYYKRYNKILRGIQQLVPLLGDCEEDLRRWSEESECVQFWRTELDLGGGVLSAESGDALASLHAEMIDEGLLRPAEPPAPPVLDLAPEVAEALRFKRKYGRDIDAYHSPNSFEVICGRSSAANEQVSLKMARSDQVWFHAAGGIPGSHVLIRANWDEVSVEDIVFAARIAAYHSKGKGQRSVPVLYCKGKQVGKIKGSPLGEVAIRGKGHVVKVEPGLPE